MLACGIVIELIIHWVLFKPYLTCSIVVFVVEQESGYLLIHIRRQLNVFNSGAENSAGSIILNSLCPIGKSATLIHLVGVHANLPLLSVEQVLEPLSLIGDNHHARFSELNERLNVSALNVIC